MLYSRDWHNIVNQLYFNQKKNKKIKMWYMYTMEYYSATKKNEILPFVAIWMDPKT